MQCVRGAVPPRLRALEHLTCVPGDLPGASRRTGTALLPAVFALCSCSLSHCIFAGSSALPWLSGTR